MTALPFTIDQAGYFFLVFTRIVTILALMPIFGAQSVPPQVKVGLALILAAFLFPSVIKTVQPLSEEFTLPLFGLLVIKEVMVGVAIGYVASLLFTAIQFAGRLVDVEMGFGFVELMDPTSNERVTVWGQLQVILFTVLFLIINGHYFMLLAVDRSFEHIPLMGAVLPNGKMIAHLSSITGTLFVTALKFAAPVYVTLILSEIALGAVARTVPQINIFFVGMPLKIAVGLGTAVLAIPVLANLFRFSADRVIQDIWRLLLVMA